MFLGAMRGSAELPSAGRREGGNRVNRILWGIALAAAPVTAHANAGIGYFMVAAPFVLVALLPAILIEACVLAPLLPVFLQRALALSFVANLQSSLLGIGLAVAVDVALMAASGSTGPEPTRASATVALIPMFFLTWRIEYRAIERRMTELKHRRVALATGTANLLSYAVMIAFVWMIMPEHGAMSVRARASEAFAISAGARLAVDDYYRSKGRLPQSGDEAGYPRNTAPVSEYMLAADIREKGVVSVKLSKSDYWPEGGEISFTPAADGDAKALRWNCRSTLAPKFLPATCRE